MWNISRKTKKRAPKTEDVEIVPWLGAFFVFNLRFSSATSSCGKLFRYRPAGKCFGFISPVPNRSVFALWCSFNRLYARLRSVHSTWILTMPRSRKRRKFISSFTMAKTPSAWMLRLTRSSFPRSVLIFSSISSRCRINFFDTYRTLLRSSNGFLLLPRMHFSFRGQPSQSLQLYTDYSCAPTWSTVPKSGNSFYFGCAMVTIAFPDAARTWSHNTSIHCSSDRVRRHIIFLYRRLQDISLIVRLLVSVGSSIPIVLGKLKMTAPIMLISSIHLLICFCWE